MKGSRCLPGGDEPWTHFAFRENLKVGGIVLPCVASQGMALRGHVTGGLRSFHNAACIHVRAISIRASFSLSVLDWKDQRMASSAKLVLRTFGASTKLTRIENLGSDCYRVYRRQRRTGTGGDWCHGGGGTCHDGGGVEMIRVAAT